MWTFDNFPAQTVKAKYGVTIDQNWRDTVMAASAKLGAGCSSSIVSPNGLVLTNHHCVRSCIQANSTAVADYVQDGFLPAKREDEKRCPGMAVEILTSISDVTQVVNAATQGAAEYLKAREGAIAAIEKEACDSKEALRCQVTALYQGGQFKLYTYRRYSDVRLAFAPEKRIAFFGGDTDNFTFPRHTLDFALVRLYENDKPVKTPQHLRWSAANPAVNEIAFVSGNPASTSRLMTVSELEGLRDIILPNTLLTLSELRGTLTQFGTESPDHARQINNYLFGIENRFKAYRGRFDALLDPVMMARKRAAEADFKAKVKANTDLAASIGDPWAELEKVQTQRLALEKPYLWLEARAGYDSDLFEYARAIVRGTIEREKPEKERLREFSDARLEGLKSFLSRERVFYADLDRVLLTFWLSKLRENLTPGSQAATLFLGKESPESLAGKLMQSRLADPAYRKALWEGGRKAVDASDDPMIRLVLLTDAASRAARKTYEDQITAPTERAEEKIAKARFAIYGTSDYPDATQTPRLSYGAVEGWNEFGTEIASFTYLQGLYARATGKTPYVLSERWSMAEKKLRPGVVFNFTTSNDVTGGNSGSPVLNARREVIGVIFDGNAASLGGDYWYDGRRNRAIALSTAAITEALKTVYHQEALVKELMGK
ncbi:S46 family peptidase [Rhizomicrobium palustre]